MSGLKIEDDLERLSLLEQLFTATLPAFMDQLNLHEFYDVEVHFLIILQAFFDSIKTLEIQPITPVCSF